MQPYTGFLLAFLLPCAVAQQTITTTDPLGETVVEVPTLDANGIPTTITVQTITPAAAPATVTTTTTDQRGNTVVEVIGGDGLGVTQTQTIQTITPAAAQGVTTTVTTTDANGASVVEVITGDGQGDSTTQTIQTIQTTAPAAPAPPGGAGPVGQPGPTGAAGLPTPYTYTTTNANGDTIAVAATFTPSVATGIPVSATFKATVLNYSQYLASYVTQTPTQNADTNNNAAIGRSLGWRGPCLSVVASILSGVLTVWGA